MNVAITIDAKCSRGDYEQEVFAGKHGLVFILRLSLT